MPNWERVRPPPYHEFERTAGKCTLNVNYWQDQTGFRFYWKVEREDNEGVWARSATRHTETLARDYVEGSGGRDATRRRAQKAATAWLKKNPGACR